MSGVGGTAVPSCQSRVPASSSSAAKVFLPLAYVTENIEQFFMKSLASFFSLTGTYSRPSLPTYRHLPDRKDGIMHVPLYHHGGYPKEEPILHLASHVPWDVHNSVCDQVWSETELSVRATIGNCPIDVPILGFQAYLIALGWNRR